MMTTNADTTKPSKQRTKPEPSELKELIARINLLPAWWQLEYIADLPNDDKYGAMFQALDAITRKAKPLADNQKNKRRQPEPERDLEDIEQRVELLKRHIFLGKDVSKDNDDNGDDAAYHNLLARISDTGNLQITRELYEAVVRYENYFNLRLNLRGFVGLRGKVNQLSVYRVVNVDVDAAGKLRFRTDELLAALDGVEYNRLGECAFCQRVFWRGRIGFEFCSSECSNLQRNRERNQRLSRADKVQRLRTKYQGDDKGLYSNKMTLKIDNGKTELLLAKGTEIVVVDIGEINPDAPITPATPIRFTVRTETGMEGDFDLMLDARYKSRLKSIFWLDD